ncbi:hypothetical protein [Nonomuraea candida]|uniref:hypothetical protein n=1 Tax=Nonomuraea candida TaxID=359159 RepID=UPI0012FABB14|nr:hypothetical protein [Nonomuraea candida]
MRSQFSPRQSGLLDVPALTSADLRDLDDSALGHLLRESLAPGREQEVVFAGFDNSTPPFREES